MSSKWITSLFKSVILTAALVSPFAASAFTEGTDYMVLEKPIPNADKTLIKVFSYACPFCYKYDKAVTGPVSDKVADLVAFTPFHLETKGEYGKQASEVFAVMIAKDQAAGISLFDAKSQFKKAKEGANKQVISSQADSLIKISRIWADFFPANTSNQPI